VDNRARVIWFGRRNEIWIVDLTASAAAPELIARSETDAPIEISYGRRENLFVQVSIYDAHLVLRSLPRRQPRHLTAGSTVRQCRLRSSVVSRYRAAGCEPRFPSGGK
jgi:hypothetical protein